MLVVGGGAVALRKVRTLLDSGARIAVGAPQLDPGLATLASTGRIAHLQGRFSIDWLDERWLVIAATDDADVNRQVATAAQARRVLCNVVDDALQSSMHSPALVRRGALQIAISSGGGAPMLARHLREWLETRLDDSWGPLTDLLTRHRQRIRHRFPAMTERRRWLARLLRGPLSGRLHRIDVSEAERALTDTLQEPSAATSRGRVALVGAGPGDPGLLTLRALRLLNEADVILHDRLVSAEVLALARRDAQFIEVGKQPAHQKHGDHATSQNRIHALMLEHASAGSCVVRLKGGDPFVFGRGGEELQFLRAHGIEYEVAPGITAALACAAYAGIPLTHRDHAQSVRLVTAHCAQSIDTNDWSALAQERQTLVFYMGVTGLDAIRTHLLAHGRAPTTPFALIENGSLPQQRVVTGTLRELAEAAARHCVRSPALLILGEVAALADALHWYGAPPLAHVVARAAPDLILGHPEIPSVAVGLARAPAPVASCV